MHYWVSHYFRVNPVNLVPLLMALLESRGWVAMGTMLQDDSANHAS